jgi:hypothetical protein
MISALLDNPRAHRVHQPCTWCIGPIFADVEDSHALNFSVLLCTQNANDTLTHCLAFKMQPKEKLNNNRWITRGIVIRQPMLPTIMGDIRIISVNPCIWRSSGVRGKGARRIGRQCNPRLERALENRFDLRKVAHGSVFVLQQIRFNSWCSVIIIIHGKD